jgi:hypothetical protein
VSNSVHRYLTLVAPPLLFTVLAFPGLSFQFLSDDFNFIHRASEFNASQLLPDPHVALYRPLSREAYFGLLAALGRSQPLVGHLFNLAIAAACIVLVASIARRLAGVRAGLLAGLLFASLGPLPFLVGWISCSQDLLAMFFTAAAIRFQISGRTALALALAGAALLSKETALFALPALALSQGILNRDWRAARTTSFYYGGLAVAWGLLNSKAGSLITKGLATGAGGYVGLDNPRILSSVAREFATLANVPIGTTRWPQGLELATVVGLCIVVATFRFLTSSKDQQSSPSSVEGSKVILFAAVLGGVPAVMTAVLAKHWFPYYACFPAIGTSLLLSLGILRLGPRYALPAVASFLLLGVGTRGMESGTQLNPTERNFGRLSSKLERVNSQLHKLHSTFPDSSRLYITVNVPVDQGIQQHLFILQAPRVWYWNRTLLTDDPGRLHPGAGREYLFAITRDLHVFEIGLPGLEVRSAGPRPDLLQYQIAIRSFAYGLVALGERHIDRAVDLLLRMVEPDSTTWAFDRRLAATFLLAGGREAEAQRLCASLPALPRDHAIQAVAAVLGPELPGLRLEDAAFQAYGVSQTDPEAYRFLMTYFSDHVQIPQARRMAERLLALEPGDEEGTAMLKAIDEIPKWEQVVPEVEKGP